MLPFLVTLAVPPFHSASAHQTPRSPSPPGAFFASFRSPALSQSKTRAFPALCFHTVTNSGFRNSIAFKILQIQGGCVFRSLLNRGKNERANCNRPTRTQKRAVSRDPASTRVFPGQ